MLYTYVASACAIFIPLDPVFKWFRISSKSVGLCIGLPTQCVVLKTWLIAYIVYVVHANEGRIFSSCLRRRSGLPYSLRKRWML